MTDYERLTRYMQVGNEVVQVIPQRKERIQAYIDRLFDLEDKIESGELISKKDVEQLESENAALIKEADENAALSMENKQRADRLEAENAVLRERLEKAVELPCKVGDTIFYVQYFCDYKGCNSTTQQFCCGCKEMIEREKRKEKYVICEKSFALKDFEKIGKKYFTTREAAESRLAELKGGKE